MSFFAPVFPNSRNSNRQTFTSHYPVRPPAPACEETGSAIYQVNQAISTPSPHSFAQALPLPIPPVSENQPLLSDTVDHLQPQLDGCGGIPRITYTLPSSVPLQIPVPEYSSPSSPPKYAPLPSSSEGTVLLAPPPNFYAATCPHQDIESQNQNQNQNPSINLIISHSCPHCFQLPSSRSLEERRRENQYDWVVIALIVLNVLVWGAVIYGYYQEWKGGSILIPHPDSDFDVGAGMVAGVGLGVGFAPDKGWAKCVGVDEDGKGWTRICAGGECTWALVDCQI